MIDPRTPILLVDDDAHMRWTIRAMLRQIGFTAIHEHDGRDTLAVLHQRPFGLVLSELMTKSLGGLELLRCVRTEPSLSFLPFIMVSGPVQAEAVQAAMSLGVDGYLVKPFSMHALQRKVFGVLELAGAAAAGRATQAQPAEAGAEQACSNTVEFAELNRYIVSLLTLMQERVKAGDLMPQDDLITVIRGYLDRAVEFGIRKAYRVEFDTIVADLGARHLAQTPHVNGVLVRQPSSQTPVALAKDRRQDAADSAAESGIERRKRREARHYIRYGAPLLHVMIDERAYRTVDWSIGGLCIGGYSGEVEPDKHLSLALQVEGVRDAEARFFGRCMVARHNAAGLLALRFESSVTPTLKVLEYLTRRRIRTEAKREAA